MKKIEEAAIDYRKIEVNEGDKNDALFSSREGIQQLVERSFKAGVEFAQKWIQVDQELPGHREVVLAKVPLMHHPLLFAYNESTREWYHYDEGDFYKSEINPIEWRHIERF